MRPKDLKGLRMKPSRVYEKKKEEDHSFDKYGVPIIKDSDIPQKSVFHFDDSRFDEEINKRGATKVSYEEFNRLTDEQERINTQFYYDLERIKRRTVAARDTMQEIVDNETPMERMKRQFKTGDIPNPLHIGDKFSNKLKDMIHKYQMEKVYRRIPYEDRPVKDTLNDKGQRINDEGKVINEEGKVLNEDGKVEGFKVYVGPETGGMPHYFFDDNETYEDEYFYSYIKKDESEERQMSDDYSADVLEAIEAADKAVLAMELRDKELADKELADKELADSELSDKDLSDIESEEDEELTDSEEPQEITLSEEDLMDLEYQSQAIGLTLTDRDLRGLEQPQKPLQL